ncbi:hypothetical protein, partial [Achromobacter ruhlandii]|uniref:hypothetical protein n=1 Tax=Achromobacter ruhlandii TaxID=72557 RepID=UPI001C2EF8FF
QRALHARSSARQLDRLLARQPATPPAQRQAAQKAMAAFADIHWLIQDHAGYFNAQPFPELSRAE